jgi:toxin ParE1/3/4
VNHRVEYSQTASADLFDIGVYLRDHAGEATAERVIRRLIAKAETLTFMPARYRLREELYPDLRAVLVDKYLIFYRVSGDVVSIVRVLHGAREIAAEMFSE